MIGTLAPPVNAPSVGADDSPGKKGPRACAGARAFRREHCCQAGKQGRKSTVESFRASPGVAVDTLAAARASAEPVVARRFWILVLGIPDRRRARLVSEDLELLGWPTPRALMLPGPLPFPATTQNAFNDLVLGG